MSAPATVDPARRCPSWPRSPGARAWTPRACAGAAAVDGDDRRPRRAVPRRRRRARRDPAARAARGARLRRPRLGHPRALRGARGERRAPAAPRRRRARGRGARRSGCSATSSATTPATCWRAPGLVLEPGRLGRVARRAGGRPARAPGRPGARAWTAGACGVAGPEPAHGRPHRAPPAGAPRRRGRPCHRGQPRLLGRAAGGCAAASTRGSGRRSRRRWSPPEPGVRPPVGRGAGSRSTPGHFPRGPRMRQDRSMLPLDLAPQRLLLVRRAPRTSRPP